MHTCVFFTLICLACFPSSATARTDWFSDGHFSAEIDLSQAGGGTLKSVKISRFQIDANLTDSFALRRASSRGDSYTCPVVVVGRLASTWCQRPNDTSFGAAGLGSALSRAARTVCSLHFCFSPLVLAIFDIQSFYDVNFHVISTTCEQFSLHVSPPNYDTFFVQ